METETRKRLLIALGLIALTVISYWGVIGNGFVSYDDDVYVLANPLVQSGLRWQNVVAAFSSTSAANWHPLTWLSHMLDVQLFGLNPAGHHLTSLVLHSANVALLFWLLWVITSAVWRSAVVAALFAVHPINVESVAWVAERKNLLSTLFMLLTIWAYVRYARNPVWQRYLTVIAVFGLALMCKPMVVTLPFVLLLLDYWPLRRIDLGAFESAELEAESSRKRGKHAKTMPGYRKRTVAQLAIEKIPLLLLAIGSSVITVIAQRAGAAVGTIEAFPLSVRFENAIVSYAKYLLDLCLPFQLAVFYPHPRAMLPLWQVGLSLLLMLAITVFVLRAKSSRYLAVGWFWYLGMLIPVIGIVQVGLQSRADRYAYVPFIGLFVAIVWYCAERFGRRASSVKGLAIGAGCILLVLAFATRIQTGYWQNSFSLFARALAVTDHNYVADNNLGELLAQQGKLDEAEAHFNASLDVNPRFPLARHNMGMLLVQKGKLDEAITEFTKAVEIKPTFTDAYNKLGAALANQGRLDEAAASFSRALEINPNYASARANLGAVYEQQGRTEDAAAAYLAALQSMSDKTMGAQLHFKLGKLAAKSGDSRGAVQHYREALMLRPDFGPAQQALKEMTPEQEPSRP